MTEMKIPELTTMYFYMTEGCNLACKHCWINPPFDPDGRKYAHISVSDFQQALAEARPLGLKSVKLTGGEPLLHPDILEFLSILKDEKLGVIIETNGTLIDNEIADLLTRLTTSAISISIDTVDPVVHDRIRNVDGAYDKAIAGVKTLVAHRIPPQIIMSLLPENKDRIADTIKLAEDLGANSFKLNIVQPTERGDQLMKQGQTLSIGDIIDIVRDLYDRVVPAAHIPVFVSIPFAFRPLHRLVGSDSGRCGIFSIIGVLATGDYALCGIGTSVPELVFGHIGLDKLSDIWASHPVLQSIRHSIPDQFEGICSDCLMSKICLGSCLAQNYYATHKLNASYWFCTQAHELGLFPSSRLKQKKQAVT